MTSIISYGAIKEIGGNKILVKDGDTKIFLDFGMCFSKMAEYYEEYIKPRTAAGLEDFIEMGLVPDVKGIYRNDLLKIMGREPEEPDVDAVFISHAHADHINHVTFLNEKIPIYMGETAYGIVDAITESTGRKLDFEIIDVKQRPLINRKAESVPRKIETFRSGKKIKVGNIEVLPIHVDHSVPGAYGFVVYCSDATIVYTGDIRLHGSHADMTKELIEKAISDDIDALITEGTRIKDNKKSSEKDVYEKSKTEISKNNKAVFVDFNFKDADRIRTFFQIAKETGKKLVIGYKEVALLKRYHKDEKLNLPSLDNDNIVLYQARKGTGTYRDQDYKVAEREYYKTKNVWRADEIHEKQKELMMFINFWNLGNLIDIKPEKDSLFIHSLSEAFNEEMAISQEREKNWLNHFALRRIQAHCSGHASGPELKELIEKIKAKEIFPIHTEHPGMFRELSSKVRMIKEGKEYVL